MVDTLREIIDEQERDSILNAEVVNRPDVPAPPAPVAPPPPIESNVPIDDGLVDSITAGPEATPLPEVPEVPDTLDFNVPKVLFSPSGASATPPSSLRPSEARRRRSDYLSSTGYSEAVGSGDLMRAHHPEAPDRIKEQAHYMGGVVVPGVTGGWSILDPETGEKITNRKGLGDLREVKKYQKLQEMKERDPVKYMKIQGKENRQIAKRLWKQGQKDLAAMHLLASRRGVDVSEIDERDPWKLLITNPGAFHKSVPYGGRITGRVQHGRIERQPMQMMRIFDHDAFLNAQQHYYQNFHGKPLDLNENEKWMKSMLPGGTGYTAQLGNLRGSVDRFTAGIKYQKLGENFWSDSERQRRNIADSTQNKEWMQNTDTLRNTVGGQAATIDKLLIEFKESLLPPGSIVTGSASGQVALAWGLLQGKNSMFSQNYATSQAKVAALNEKYLQSQAAPGTGTPVVVWDSRDDEALRGAEGKLRALQARWNKAEALVSAAVAAREGVTGEELAPKIVKQFADNNKRLGLRDQKKIDAEKWLTHRGEVDGIEFNDRVWQQDENKISEMEESLKSARGDLKDLKKQAQDFKGKSKKWGTRRNRITSSGLSERVQGLHDSWTRRGEPAPVEDADIDDDDDDFTSLPSRIPPETDIAGDLVPGAPDSLDFNVPTILASPSDAPVAEPTLEQLANEYKASTPIEPKTDKDWEAENPLPADAPDEQKLRLQIAKAKKLTREKESLGDIVISVDPSNSSYGEKSNNPLGGSRWDSSVVDKVVATINAGIHGRWDENHTESLDREKTYKTPAWHDFGQGTDNNLSDTFSLLKDDGTQLTNQVFPEEVRGPRGKLMRTIPTHLVGERMTVGEMVAIRYESRYGNVLMFDITGDISDQNVTTKYNELLGRMKVVR